MVLNGWCFYNIKDDYSLIVGENGLKCYIVFNLINVKLVFLFGDLFVGYNILFWDYLGKKLNLNIYMISMNWCYLSFDKEFIGDKLFIVY